MKVYLVIKEIYWLGDGTEYHVIGCYANEQLANDAVITFWKDDDKKKKKDRLPWTVHIEEYDVTS